jgi:hypothetical protein
MIANRIGVDAAVGVGVGVTGVGVGVTGVGVSVTGVGVGVSGVGVGVSRVGVGVGSRMVNGFSDDHSGPIGEPPK